MAKTLYITFAVIALTKFYKLLLPDSNTALTGVSFDSILFQQFFK
jgi:hypothetical protein